MHLFGFKPSRYVEWQAVLAEEKRSQSLVSLLARMFLVFIKGLPSLKENRRTWRAKMRVCAKCPIYDRGLHRCRPYTGSPAGCGCSVIFKALFSRTCWADDVVPDEKIGWTTRIEIVDPAHRKPQRSTGEL